MNPIQNPDAQARPPVSHCGRCDGEVWSDEPIFQWDGQWICLDCFKDAIKAMLEDDPVLLAYISIHAPREGCDSKLYQRAESLLGSICLFAQGEEG